MKRLPAEVGNERVHDVRVLVGIVKRPPLDLRDQRHTNTVEHIPHTPKHR